MGDGNPQMFPIKIGLVGGYLQEQMINAGFEPTGWTKPVKTIANLAGLYGKKEQQGQVATILDRYCKLPTFSGKKWSGVRTWFQYGVCAGESTVGLSSRTAFQGQIATVFTALGIDVARAGVGGFLNEATVLGQDYFGRYTISQAMGIYNEVAEKWGEMA